MAQSATARCLLIHREFVRHLQVIEANAMRSTRS